MAKINYEDVLQSVLNEIPTKIFLEYSESIKNNKLDSQTSGIFEEKFNEFLVGKELNNTDEVKLRDQWDELIFSKLEEARMAQKRMTSVSSSNKPQPSIDTRTNLSLYERLENNLHNFIQDQKPDELLRHLKNEENGNGTFFSDFIRDNVTKMDEYRQGAELPDVKRLLRYRMFEMGYSHIKSQDPDELLNSGKNYRDMLENSIAEESKRDKFASANDKTVLKQNLMKEYDTKYLYDNRQKIKEPISEPSTSGFFKTIADATNPIFDSAKNDTTNALKENFKTPGRAIATTILVAATLPISAPLTAIGWLIARGSRAISNAVEGTRKPEGNHGNQFTGSPRHSTTTDIFAATNIDAKNATAAAKTLNELLSDYLKIKDQSKLLKDATIAIMEHPDYPTIKEKLPPSPGKFDKINVSNALNVLNGQTQAHTHSQAAVMNNTQPTQEKTLIDLLKDYQKTTDKDEKSNLHKQIENHKDYPELQRKYLGVNASETNLKNVIDRYITDHLRIPVDPNKHSGPQANTNSGFIRTPIPAYANKVIGSRGDYLLSIAGL